MKIVYNENPLRTVVELDDHDREIFRLKLKVEELQKKLFDAHFSLTEADYFNLDRARRDVDPTYYLKEDDNERTPLDERVDKLFETYVEELQGIHFGDCTCVACSCLKCRAEKILGIDTLKPFPGKHELSCINGAFSYNENGELKQRSLNEALMYLKEHKISREKPESWKHTTQEQYESYVPRWEAEQARAYEYLVNYAKDRLVIA